MNRKKGFYKNCEVCGIEFYIINSRANKNVRFCSRKCMGIANTKKIKTRCSYCNKDILVEPNRIRDKNFCDNECKFLSRQVGCGLTTDKYVWIRVGNEQVKVHRYLMEVKLGRKLKPSEIVHHIDFNKFNNSIDNLEVLTITEHNKKHNALGAENRTDTYSKEEDDAIKSGMTYNEFNLMFQGRTRGAFHQRKSRLKSCNDG